VTFTSGDTVMIRERVKSGLERTKGQAMEGARSAASRKGSRDPRRFAERQGRDHQALGGALRWRWDGPADQAGADVLRAGPYRLIPPMMRE
jgi:hypothetical protein